MIQRGISRLASIRRGDCAKPIRRGFKTRNAAIDQTKYRLVSGSTPRPRAGSVIMAAQAIEITE